MPLASYEQAELNAQDRRNDRIADAVESAHARFMRGRQNFMESNPNAVSNFERKAVLGRAQELDDRSNLRAHEINMLRQTGENEAEVQKLKTEGMIGQGRDAARANADATIKSSENNLAGKKYEIDASQAIAKDRNATELTIAEKKIAGELDVEKERQGGALDIAETQGKNAIAVEKEKGNASGLSAAAAAAARERQYEHEVSLQRLKNDGRSPSNEETKAFVRMRNDPRYKNLSDREIWEMLKRGGES